jgi:hypothetical protein
MPESMTLNSIKQSLEVARKRQQLDPQDTMETRTYIAHVERLLIELEEAITMNQRQSNNIRAYITRLESMRTTTVH